MHLYLFAKIVVVKTMPITILLLIVMMFLLQCMAALRTSLSQDYSIRAPHEAGLCGLPFLRRRTFSLREQGFIRAAEPSSMALWESKEELPTAATILAGPPLLPASAQNPCAKRQLLQ